MDYFKIEKDPFNSKYYIIVPTSFLLLNYTSSNEEVYFSSLLIKCYNFSLRDFYGYLITKFHAKILIEKNFPYFKICFDRKIYAEDFVKEVNERMAQRSII